MKVGLVGWRGMVGSVLMQRMVEENDFAHFEPFYFTTSNVGAAAPNFGGKSAPALLDAKNISALKNMDAIISCQGGDYTGEVFSALRAAGWQVAGGTALFRLYHTPDAPLAQARLARAQIWSRIFPWHRHWLRLGLPGDEGEWARLAAALT